MLAMNVTNLSLFECQLPDCYHYHTNIVNLREKILLVWQNSLAENLPYSFRIILPPINLLMVKFKASRDFVKGNVLLWVILKFKENYRGFLQFPTNYQISWINKS
ncbi:hypothetical protein CVS40_12562 [Lucilia cuprina]|nr:hypothetical protein CVS40_12562 [Lucilia cuprina]